MHFFRHNDDYISLPNQEVLFTLPFSLFGHIEKRSLTALGWRWRKRAVVLNSSGHLIIYKYFLEGIGAGKPFLGRIIHLDAVQYIQARMDKDVCYIKIYDHSRRRIELRIKGTKARLWAAKVFMYEAPLNDCKQRSKSAEIEWPIERPLKVLDSKISTSSIYDVSATSANCMKESSKITIASVSSEDMERIRISEVVTACRTDSELSNDERISMQGDNMICEKCKDQKFEANGLLKCSKSVPEFIAADEFPTAKEASRSISFDQLDRVIVSRQDRFRKHLQSMIESQFYESLSDCSLNYSISSIQKLHAQAGKMSQVYIAYNRLFIKNEVPPKHQITQHSGPSLPLSIDINCKLRELKHDDQNDTDIVYRF
uniref:PH_15 domain-containing protein n=1 Tax=Onchocerca volvulus TaxID=6282 RepID=A0A8R1TY09_ONCVO